MPAFNKASIDALSSADLQGVARASEILLSPLDYESVDAWRGAANRAVCDLVGADRLHFILRTGQAPAYFTEQHSTAELPHVVATYEHLAAPLLAKYGVTQRQVALGAWSTRLLWGEEGLREVYRSAYHGEFIVPFRYFDRAGLTIRDANGQIADFRCSRESPRGRSLARRAVAIFRLLQPSFRAGVDTWLRAGEHRFTLESVIDAMGDGCALSADSGMAVHRNRALCDLIEGLNPEDQLRLGVAMDRSMTAASARLTIPFADKVPAINVRTSSGDLRVRSTRVSHRGAHRLTLTVVQRVRPEAVGDELLRAHFRLSDRECQVARALADGRPTRAIALTLGVSVHTVRRHTERVLQKLGVSSRVDIRARLTSIAS